MCDKKNMSDELTHDNIEDSETLGLFLQNEEATCTTSAVWFVPNVPIAFHYDYMFTICLYCTF